MTMSEQYVHGYHGDEDTRLADQAGTLIELLHDGITFPPGSTVLEVGCGVGAQTVTLAQRSPEARITSIDVSADSVARAERRIDTAGIGNVSFAVADVFALPTTDGPLAPAMFDHVFVCLVLEHLRHPLDALERLRHLLKPGGTLTVIEGDHGSTYFHPDSDAAREAIACQVTLQARAGGNANIGRQLYPLLAQAGYDAVRAEPRTVYVDATRPALVDGFIRKTFTAMITGIREPALAAGLITAERFDEGITDLYRTAESDGVFSYTFFRATGVKADGRAQTG